MAPQWAWHHDQGTHSPMPLGDSIKQVRKEAGWSQAELGERIGTDPGRISRYESGRITPSADALVRIAEALDVSLDYLLVDDIPRRPLHTPDHHLGERFNHLEELDEEDLSSLLNHLDGLIAKKRLKTIAGDLA